MDDDELFNVAPGDFVAARNALAERVKAAGDAARAKEIRARRRPSPSVWAVNALARREPKLMGELLESGEALRAAEREALRGASGAAYLEAGRVERELIAQLVARAEALLGEVAASAASSVLRRIGTMLHAGAIGDADARAKLSQGRMMEELTTSAGFPSDEPEGEEQTTLALHRTEDDGQGHGESQGAAAKARGAASRDAAERAAAAERAEQLRRLRRDAQGAEVAADRARKELARLERDAETAARRADEAAAAADRLRAEAEAARQRLADAREGADREAAHARDTAERLRALERGSP